MATRIPENDVDVYNVSGGYIDDLNKTVLPADIRAFDFSRIDKALKTEQDIADKAMSIIDVNLQNMGKIQDDITGIVASNPYEKERLDIIKKSTGIDSSTLTNAISNIENPVALYDIDRKMKALISNVEVKRIIQNNVMLEAFRTNISKIEDPYMRTQAITDMVDYMNDASGIKKVENLNVSQYKTIDITDAYVKYINAMAPLVETEVVVNNPDGSYHLQKIKRRNPVAMKNAQEAFMKNNTNMLNLKAQGLVDSDGRPIANAQTGKNYFDIMNESLNTIGTSISNYNDPDQVLSRQLSNEITKRSLALSSGTSSATKSKTQKQRSTKKSTTTTTSNVVETDPAVLPNKDGGSVRLDLSKPVDKMVADAEQQMGRKLTSSESDLLKRANSEYKTSTAKVQKERDAEPDPFDLFYSTQNKSEGGSQNKPLISAKESEAFLDVAPGTTGEIIRGISRKTPSLLSPSLKERKRAANQMKEADVQKGGSEGQPKLDGLSMEQLREYRISQEKDKHDKKKQEYLAAREKATASLLNDGDSYLSRLIDKGDAALSRDSKVMGITRDLYNTTGFSLSGFGGDAKDLISLLYDKLPRTELDNVIKKAASIGIKYDEDKMIEYLRYRYLDGKRPKGAPFNFEWDKEAFK